MYYIERVVSLDKTNLCEEYDTIYKHNMQQVCQILLFNSAVINIYSVQIIKQFQQLKCKQQFVILG